MMQAVRAKQDANRPTAAARGYDWQHQQIRKQVLIRDGYKCRYCGGKATTADHVKPLKTHPELRHDPDNMVACCQTCQNQKGDQQR
jgi:5-methylcytosine-specific restriction endonuclease McrA